jgi:hypothetical protein
VRVIGVSDLFLVVTTKKPCINSLPAISPRRDDSQPAGFVCRERHYFFEHLSQGWKKGNLGRNWSTKKGSASGVYTRGMARSEGAFASGFSRRRDGLACGFWVVHCRGACHNRADSFRTRAETRLGRIKVGGCHPGILQEGCGSSPAGMLSTCNWSLRGGQSLISAADKLPV